MVDRDEIVGMQQAIEAAPPLQQRLFPGLEDALQATRDAAAATSRPGRPPGQQNRSTIASREKVLQLAEELGITPLEYLWRRMLDPETGNEERHRSAVALLPYTAQKTPVDVNIERRSFNVTLELGGGAMAEAEEGGDLVIEGGLEE